jgi:endonuclease/exonuclease/phosphatase family metal-dependent hydrolase
MSRWARSLLFLAVLVGPIACAEDGLKSPLALNEAALALRGGPAIMVMSQNMYLGANIDLLLTAESAGDVAQVFEQLTTSTLAGDFGRARQMAYQIATHAPHLVGLQEVTRYDMATPMGVQTLDFIYVLQAYLGYFHMVLGTPMYTVVRSDWTTVTFPASAFGPFPDVTYTDGDAILVRSDVTLVGEPTMKQFDAYEVFSVAGTSFDYRRGYMAVTARIGDLEVRFGNTHLEVQHFAETQVAQAAEMIAAFEDETIPVILVGDCNSAANPHAPARAKTASYRMFRNSGYADIWLREPHSVGGETCCQAPDLTSPESELDERLDLVLVRWGKAGFGGQTSMDVIGEEPGDRIEVLPGLWLWPSDHAGVIATLWPAPGRVKTQTRAQGKK